MHPNIFLPREAEIVLNGVLPSAQRRGIYRSLVLAAGMTVKVVEGERWNIKVTVKEDLEIMASFLAGKKLAMSDGEMVD